jgi:hypothetical protein
MKRKIDIVLDDCLVQLRAGATAEDCLARYPEHAEALRPLLTLAMQVQSLPTPSPDRAAMNAGRQRMVEAVRARAGRQGQARLLGLPWFKNSRPFAGEAFGRPLVRSTLSLVLALLVFALSAAGLVAAAQVSLPGELLYPLKRTAEDVRMSLTFDPVAREQLQQSLDQERQAETRAVLTTGRPASLEFRGMLEHLDPQYWIVSGLRVDLDDHTIVEGQPVLAAFVIVHVDTPGDGTLLARRLRVEGAPLPPSPTPTISPTLPSPTVSATAAQTQTPLSTAPATPTPSRQATQTPSIATPTAQPQPTDPPPPPTHTREPQATEHPKPGETEEPEATEHPEPGESPEPEDTDHPEASETPEPEDTDHPESGEIPEPEDTDHPEPGETPEPEDTDRPESTPHPEPSATETPKPAPTTAPTQESASLDYIAAVASAAPRLAQGSTTFFCLVTTCSGDAFANSEPAAHVS